MNKILKYINVGLTVFVLTSCNYSQKKSGGAAPLTENKTQLSANQKITFNLVKSISLKTCFDCHGGDKQSPDLSQAAVVQGRKDDIWHEVDSGSMPPAKKGYAALKGCEKELLRKWVDLGAPENSDVAVSEVQDCKDLITPITPTTPVVPPTPPPQVVPILLMPLNYNSLHERILKAKCLNCHTPPAPGAPVDVDAPESFFDTYANLMKVEKIWSAPAAQSKVYKEITDKDDGMPPPESKITSLTDDEVEFIRRWVDAGKPEK